MTGRTVARILGVATALLFALGIAFRATLYSRLYLAPGAPYGIADLIEFVLGWLLLGALAASAVAGLVLAVRGPTQNRWAAAGLFVTVIVLLALLDPLHTLAAQWSAR